MATKVPRVNCSSLGVYLPRTKPMARYCIGSLGGGIGCCRRSKSRSDNLASPTTLSVLALLLAGVGAVAAGGGGGVGAGKGAGLGGLGRRITRSLV